jgi:hypothetical protein
MDHRLRSQARQRGMTRFHQAGERQHFHLRRQERHDKVHAHGQLVVSADGRTLPIEENPNRGEVTHGCQALVQRWKVLVSSLGEMCPHRLRRMRLQ